MKRKKTLIIDEVEALVNENGMELIQDFVISIAADKGNLVIYHCGCEDKAPYETLYDREEVEAAIAFLKDYQTK